MNVDNGEHSPSVAVAAEPSLPEDEHEVVEAGNAAEPGHAELTPRQRQILELLQAGKVNKEIASELGIGVGTVKQHVVALFKRLNVRNRAMAVSRGMSLLHAQQDSQPVRIAGGLLMRRPCIVLSLVLPEAAERRAVRLMHGFLAALAFDHDALFLARQGNAGDLIFGVQRVTEFDIVKALQTAYAIHADLQEQFADLAGQLRGGLSAGLAVASMKRFGGWSGEAVASEAIGIARSLAEKAPFGRVAIGKEAREMMAAFGVVLGGASSTLPGFADLGTVRWSGERLACSLFGRQHELAELSLALRDAGAGRGSLWYLRGEAGMGKSRLCRELAGLAANMGCATHVYQVQPDVSGASRALSGGGGVALTVDEAIQVLHSLPPHPPALLVIDDFHGLPDEGREVLARAALETADHGHMAVIAMRRPQEAVPERAKTIRLGKLPSEELDKLVEAVLTGKGGAPPRGGIAESMVEKAGGVPLFAVELAKCRGDWKKALSLMVVVCSRLDEVQTDCRLVNAVARNSGKATLKDLSLVLGESVAELGASLKHAVNSGVVQEGPDGRLSIAHPLLRQMIEYLDME